MPKVDVKAVEKHKKELFEKLNEQFQKIISETKKL